LLLNEKIYSVPLPLNVGRNEYSYGGCFVGAVRGEARRQVCAELISI
jgi:hypothetical protein